MKILITGGSGLLGEYLNIELSQKHQILTLYNSSFGNCKDFDSAKLDITNQSSLQNVFNDYKQNVVIHTAAISNPILTDNISLKDVYKINVVVTKNIAE